MPAGRRAGQNCSVCKEVESYRIQPGQDLNSHLDLLYHANERWLNIDLMESKLLELGSAQIHRKYAVTTTNTSISKEHIDRGKYVAASSKQDYCI